MPLNVQDLKSGDRVMLNCPTGRIPKREAIFEGIFKSLEEAAQPDKYHQVITMCVPSEELLRTGAFARFLLGRGVDWELVAAFRVEPDGGLREDEGRRVFIERRLPMGVG
jgi:hypothetical protein